jgi:hypothetical protein
VHVSYSCQCVCRVCRVLTTSRCNGLVAAAVRASCLLHVCGDTVVAHIQGDVPVVSACQPRAIRCVRDCVSVSLSSNTLTIRQHEPCDYHYCHNCCAHKTTALLYCYALFTVVVSKLSVCGKLCVRRHQAYLSDACVHRYSIIAHSTITKSCCIATFKTDSYHAR